MPIQTFNPRIAPSPGTNVSQKIRLRKADFGDGLTYLQRDGLNHIRRSIKLSWDLLHPLDAAYIVDFLKLHAGTYPFWYTPSDDYTAIKWTCSEWTDDRIEGGYRRISATFEESFDNRTETGLREYVPRATVPGSASAQSSAIGRVDSVVASSGTASGYGAASFVLSTDYVSMNFLNETYYLSGNLVTLPTLLTNTDYTIDTNGLRVLDVSSPADLTPAAFAALPVQGFSLVVEWADSASTPFDYAYPLSMWQLPDYTDYIYVESATTGTSVYIGHFNESLNVQIPYSDARDAIRRVAITCTPAHAAVSVNGGTVQSTDFTDTSPQTFMTTRLAGYENVSTVIFDGYIRYVRYFPVVDDTELPTLSALA